MQGTIHYTAPPEKISSKQMKWTHSQIRAAKNELTFWKSYWYINIFSNKIQHLGIKSTDFSDKELLLLG